MNSNSKYKILKKQIFISELFSLVPIRFEDRLDIMNWRNEQIYHLRQNKTLTPEDQDNYFNTVILKLFEQETPNQILFSFLENGICIGYGGLVHINWIDKNAEISFIMKTNLEEDNFEKLWSMYLGLIEQVGFDELQLHKLYVYAFDLRSHLYATLTSNNYFLDGRLTDHCLFQGEFKDVLIHSKLRK
jgi:RimJ/RimL family protein N-acetyltransferase